ncbi:short-chain dehydrogenase [Frankia sp. CcI49]|uniref:SDR family NAD(P)-dependent oxidoreductase n=1 Tax=Frankia sp. CcI49 TaxID=1745382 RepID=UPI0009767914|nr:SDR family oxidoreductase [Frankia sp. CcI49]ONH59260.1 short-chain dehydrogenase [Frankia sp. CcI49]
MTISPLQDQTALVTGSTDGIGAAIATQLAAAGAHVLVTGRDHGRGRDVVAAVAAAGGTATFLRADLAGGSAAVTGLAAAVHDTTGRPLDILVHNAARLVDPAPTDQVDEDVINGVLAVNVTAAFLLTAAFAPAMAAAGSGAIINIGSVNGLIGMAGSALYGASKAALHSLTRSWAAEYGPRGVRVNTIAPGPTLTRRTEAISDHLAPMLARVPSRRASTLDEVAAAAVFLAGPAAANIHGATLTVDGGWSAL